MDQNNTLWSRFGHWLDSFKPDDTVPQLTLTSTIASVPPQSLSPDDECDSSAEKSSNRLMPWRKRDQILEQLQGGYDKVLDLVGSIQDHLALHNKRSDQVAELLMVLSKGIEDVPKATRQHADSLTGLTLQLEIENRHNRTIVDAISELPRSAEAQRRGMEAIATQVQASTAVTEKLSGRLDSVGQVVKLLGEALDEQVHTLKVVQQAARHQENQVVAILDHQSRRSAKLTASTIGLAAVLAIATAISLFT
jgi:hypothetical protein